MGQGRSSPRVRLTRLARLVPSLFLLIPPAMVGVSQRLAPCGALTSLIFSLSHVVRREHSPAEWSAIVPPGMRCQIGPAVRAQCRMSCASEEVAGCPCTCREPRRRAAHAAERRIARSLIGTRGDAKVDQPIDALGSQHDDAPPRCVSNAHWRSGVGGSGVVVHSTTQPA